MDKYFRIAFAVILALIIILSCTVFGSKATDASSYSHTIEVLDKSRMTVLGLSAASAAASAAVSALPDDICSPIADEISEFSTWFLAILSVITLEKYLLTILGAVACYILIPIGCSLLLICCFFPGRSLMNIGIKLVSFASALLFVIPTSVWVSDQINSIYSKSIEITIVSANAVSDNLIGDIEGESSESTSVIDEAKELLSSLSGSVAKVIDQFKNVLNRFIEATAVMFVTTCLIPILVLLFYAWVVKIIFNVQISIPSKLMKPVKQRPALNETKE